MKIVRVSAVFICLSLASLVSGRADDSATRYSKADVHKMIREAHSADQYRALAGYYRAQQANFRQQAKAELQEWDRRSQNVTSISAKYPRPVDSSRNRYEYFAYKAKEMEQRALHYENLAANAH
ncbi:MAG TPA: hypothetical protein VKR52_11360 [Terracidiphilus sp.]|nr:hypothetical protein [Terracidiphilus sp.]